MNNLEVEPTGTSDFGPCPCCCNNSRRVWGLVRNQRRALASYFIDWTLTRVHDHGASFDLIIGRWGDRSSASDRALVSLDYRLLKTGPTFMAIDAAERLFASSDLVGRALSREEVIGKPISKLVFAIVDAVLDQDERVAELLGSSR